MNVWTSSAPPSSSSSSPTRSRSSFPADAVNAAFGRAVDPATAARGQSVCDRAARLMETPLLAGFEWKQEPAAVQAAYGATTVGRHCLVARRLIESGVTCVEVEVGDWDSHKDNFTTHRDLLSRLDPAFSALLDDLRARSLLDSTLIVCAGEFGRSPSISKDEGRDHHTACFSAVLAGGGLRAGQALGQTDANGARPVGRAVTVPDLLATILVAAGSDPEKTWMLGDRPITLGNGGKALVELVGARQEGCTDRPFGTLGRVKSPARCGVVRPVQLVRVSCIPGAALPRRPARLPSTADVVAPEAPTLRELTAYTQRGRAFGTTWRRPDSLLVSRAARLYGAAVGKKRVTLNWMEPIRVLVCDDSPLMRRLLVRMLAPDSGVLVVAEADNGEECLARIVQVNPDVVLLDLAMPILDGVSCLREARLRKLEPAFVVVSTQAKKDAPVTLEALREGAIDFVTKAQGMLQMDSIQSLLLTKVRAAFEARQRNRIQPEMSVQPLPAAPPSAPPVTAAGTTAATTPEVRPVPKAALSIIGGAAGCLQALAAILSAMPLRPTGCIVLALKLPAFLTRQMPAQFRKSCPVPVEIAAPGAPLQLGKIYLAPGGDQNLVLERDAAAKKIVFRLVSAKEAKEGAPSINALMHSAAILFRDRARGILISGTGRDGIEGLRAILAAGGETIAQERASAIAPQLPMLAVEEGVATRTLTPKEIAGLFRQAQ